MSTYSARNTSFEGISFHSHRKRRDPLDAKKPNWEDAASEILTVTIPLLLKAGRENGVSLTDLGTFRTKIVAIIRKEAQPESKEPA